MDTNQTFNFYKITIAEACKSNNLTFVKFVVNSNTTDLLEGVYEACSQNNHNIVEYLINTCLTKNIKIDKSKCVELSCNSGFYNRNIMRTIRGLLDGLCTFTNAKKNELFVLNAGHCVTHSDKHNRWKKPTTDWAMPHYRQLFIRINIFELELDEILQKNCNGMYDKNILPLISAYIEFGE